MGAPLCQTRSNGVLTQCLDLLLIQFGGVPLRSLADTAGKEK